MWMPRLPSGLLRIGRRHGSNAEGLVQISITGAFRDYPGLRSRVRVVGHQVEVTLTMPYRLPIPVPGVQPTTLVHATSAAELPIYQ